MEERPTIAAIATPPGRGGVAVVRVSGPDAPAIARRLTGVEPEAGRVRFVRFRTPGDPPAELDTGLLLAFSAPHSYTGEDVVEFQCHGGGVVPKQILGAAVACGARLAHRGEFTRRAFLNGKLDYEQAAAVLDLIDARTVRAADAARDVLSGRGRQTDRALYDAAVELSATLEHALDVDEDELPPAFLPEVSQRLEDLRRAIGDELHRRREGHILRTGACVVLAGAPNAGKSSLMNALLGENRAIVSATPGTTRDSIEEWLDIAGWPVRLVDTAGLREGADAVEAEGVRRAEALIRNADLVLGLDCDLGLRVHSKCDLGFGAGLNVSAKTGEGLENLKAAIAAELERKAVRDDACPASDDDQTLSLLHEALSSLPKAVDDLVLAANGLRTASERLGACVGAVYGEDVLDRLFSRFCVGK